MTRRPLAHLTLIVLAAALLGGCGSHSPGAGPAGQSASKAAAKKPLTREDEFSRNMVSAVAANKPSMVPVQVKFDLRDRPDVGQPVQVDLAIVPMSASVDRVSGKVEGEDGLELTEGAEIAATERPAEGVPIRHAVKVLPRRQGIFTVRAVVTVDAGGVASTESYSMPVIAGAGAGENPGKPGPPATAAVTAAAPARVSDAHPNAGTSAAAQ
jgi:hypothetical protein